MKVKAALLFFVICPLFAVEDFNSVCKKISSQKRVSGDFVLENNTGKNIFVSSGTFLISAGEGIIFWTREPIKSTRVLGVDWTVNISAEGKIKKIDAKGNKNFNAISESLRAVFSGSEDAVLKNFDVDFISESGKWSMTLLPKASSPAAMVFAEVVIEGVNFIDDVIIKSGKSKLHYKFSAQKSGGVETYKEEEFFKAANNEQ